MENNKQFLKSFLRSYSQLWSYIGFMIGALGLCWVFYRIDYTQLHYILHKGNHFFLMLVPVFITLEQFLRAIKWHKLLIPLKSIKIFRLFGATMAAYFLNMLVPFGISPIVRSYLIARLENLTVVTVFTTVTVDRFIDGMVFGCLGIVMLSFSVIPFSDAHIKFGILIGSILSVFGVSILFFILSQFKRNVLNLNSWIVKLLRILPIRLASFLETFLKSVVQGFVLPAHWSTICWIFFLSIVIKILGVLSYFLAGIAFDANLPFSAYLFLFLCLGFVIVLSRVVAIPGGFFLGSVFVFDLLGVAKEEALVMIMVVHFSALFSVGLMGSFTLWKSGIAFSEIRKTTIML